jgi:hypothetical protein
MTEREYVMMPSGDKRRAQEIKVGGGKMDFVWIVWEMGNGGPTLTYWLRRPA